MKDTFVSRGVFPRMGLQCIGFVGYETGLEIFDLLGLTSPSVAHSPIRRRSRPGHEKKASPAQIYNDGALLTQWPVYPPPFRHHGRIQVGRFKYLLSRYDKDVIRAINATPGAKPPVDEEGRLTTLFTSSTPVHQDDLWCGLWHSWSYYFRANPDSTLRRQAVSWVQKNIPVIGEAARFVFPDEDPASLGFEPALDVTFDEPMSGWRASGDAFEHWPSEVGLAIRRLWPRTVVRC